MKNNTPLILIACVIIAVLGTLDFANRKSEVHQAVVAKASSPELDKVTEEFNKIQSKEDKVLIHKLFVGASQYLLNCTSLKSTSQFDPILARVQSTYGWERKKYMPFSQAVYDYLESVGYLQPKKLENQSQRFEFALIFTNLAEATKYE